MKLVALCSLLLPSVVATLFGSNSVVITSQDVHQGLSEAKLALTQGQTYRVYAVYASSAMNDDYVSKVVIKGRDNAQITVAALAKPKVNTDYFLDETHIMTAPFTIEDTNEKPTHGFLEGGPYTIYIISTEIMVSPVISAQLINGQVASSGARMNSASCTVLSAEGTVLISNMDTGSSSIDKIAVKTTGFDVLADENTVLTVTKETMGSSVQISGPIATLYNTNTQSANFSFSMERKGPMSGSLSPGASTAFLSNGWLSVGESYKTDYVNDGVLWRNYDFGRDTLISFAPVVGAYYPDSGDSITFACKKANGQSTDYNCGSLAGSVQTDWCKHIELMVHLGTGTVDGPRFRVQIESGALSISIFAMLIASLIGILFN